jgi:hypothetical protein
MPLIQELVLEEIPLRAVDSPAIRGRDIHGSASPFYFRGDYKDDNMKHVKVFCKVWQVMEEKKYFETIHF